MGKQKVKSNYIYLTTDLINNIIYVGQRQCWCTPEKDIRYLGSGTKLNVAIKEFGKENFKKIILEVCLKENLNKQEKYWVAFNDANNPLIGYNLTSGGAGNTVFSKEVTEKQGLKLKELHKNNPEIAKRTSASNKITWSDPKLLKEHSERAKNARKENPEIYKKSAEKQRKTKKEKKENNPEWSLEEKKRNSERMKKFYEENPDAKTNNRNKLLEHWKDPDAVEKAKQTALNRPILNCQFCNKSVKGYSCLGNHVKNCKLNSDYVKNIKFSEFCKERELSKPIENCPYCNKEFKGNSIGNHKKFCLKQQNS